MKYSDSGVDIDRAGRAKKKIAELARSTFNSSVIGEVGAFGGLFRPDLETFPSPVLVSSADGVGTKLKIAFLTGVHNTVGIDLVAHCTNDILVQGALPLFFLDYIATGKLEPGVVEAIVEGVAKGCCASSCVLLGGETAEMPDFYRSGEYDLAGFIVGAVDEFKILSPRNVSAGDVLIGLPSSGLHTNGYSLVRKVLLEQEKLTVDSPLPECGRTVGEELLIPHRNYLPVLRQVVLSEDVRAMAHITGGGITDNLARALPEDADAVVRRGAWDIPPIFQVLRERGRIEEAEMYRTFNMGLGMILVVDRERVDRLTDHLTGLKEAFHPIGEVVPGGGEVRYA